MNNPWRVILTLLTVAGCAGTKPGTHVELVDQDGRDVYVAGAVAPGVNQSLACSAAVSRAVQAIGDKFAAENDDLGDDIAEAMGARDGEVFLQRYAKDSALDAAVQDVKFNPTEHMCMATIRWTPDVFIKEQVLKHAQAMKARELGQAPGADAAVAPAQVVPQPATVAPVASPPPPPVSVAPAVAAPAQAGAPPAAVVVAPPTAPVQPAPVGPAPVAAVPACAAEKKSLAKTTAASTKALADFEDCMSRTKRDETICHRYKLYVDEAAQKERAAATPLVACLNQGLSTPTRRVLGAELAGHAAVPVENRADGTLILWTYAPLDKTAFALEVGPDGASRSRSALAANQVQWVRQQLGL